MVSISYSHLSLGDWGGHCLPKRQKTKQIVPNHSRVCSFTMVWVFFLGGEGEFNRLILVSRGKQQWRVLCLPDLPGLALERCLNTENHITLSVL